MTSKCTRKKLKFWSHWNSVEKNDTFNTFKGGGMGPWLVLVSPCFRENVVATCKIGSFLCSLDNLLQKKRNCSLFLEVKFQNGAHLKKGLFLTYFAHFLVTRKSYKNSYSAYLTHIHTRILLILLTFFALPILKKNTNLSHTVSLWYESWCWFLFGPFWNNQKITKWWEKFKLECQVLICTYTNAKFMVICKPRTLNDGGKNSVKYRNRKKYRFLAAAILLFIGKIIITW